MPRIEQLESRRPMTMIHNSNRRSGNVRPASTFFRGARARSRGMSSIVLLLVLGMAAIALIATLKLMPLYVENWGVQNILAGIAEEYEQDARIF